jgi:NodT family efflux transporter outer membrane factor (OMF) lipoprotein
MSNTKIFKYVVITCVSLIYTGCKLPSNLVQRTENKKVPVTYSNNSQDSINAAKVKWKDFFTDSYLSALIDTALKNNQELNIILQEINISQNEVRARKGAYLPFLGLEGGAGVEKSGLYTRNGSVDATNDIAPGKKIPEALPNYLLAANISWEVDIWKKLRNSKNAALARYLSSIEGKNFMVTHLISEIANSYYELMALDNQLEILKKNIEIQQNALDIVKQEKKAARVTELAVRRFEAEVLKNQSRQFYIAQQIIETENRINFLVGRFPQPILRNSQTFANLAIDTIHAGIPSQLLENRPDVRQAEKQLLAAKLDVKAAKAEFYPSLMIMAGVGYQAFNPQYLLKMPESLIYNLVGDLMAPLINRNAIKANYYSANSKQIQAVYNYERAILNAHIEVANQLSNINNLKKSYDLKAKQVLALTQSIDISLGLFKSARADYMEVLLTQRDALQSKFELIETKKQQMNAKVNVYRALGGGWR